ncbi:MAG: zinc ribbon domain-containing protein [Treponema sp.]|nr:zinc ribbon domain-containing protein [Treponema sp.]
MWGVPEPKILCRNCGKELQAEWKACPYCGVQVADAHRAIPASTASGSPGAGYGIRLIEPPTASRPDVPRPIPQSPVPPPAPPVTTVNTPENPPIQDSKKDDWAWSASIALIIVIPLLLGIFAMFPIINNPFAGVPIYLVASFIISLIVEKIRKIIGRK